MRGNAKRLDVCLGDFAVSIQGYDDPVAVLKDVLHIAQRVAADTPDLLNSEAAFDEDTILKVIDRVAARVGVDADSLGAVPGLVLVHRGEETDGGLDAIRRVAMRAEPIRDKTGDSASDEAGAPADEPADDDAETPETSAAARAADDRIEALRRRYEERGDPFEQDAPSGAEAGSATQAEDAGAPVATAEKEKAGAEAEGDGARVVNIFGAPVAAKADAAAKAEPETTGAGEGRRPLFARAGGSDGDGAKPKPMPVPRPAPIGEAGGLGDRFESLLARVHGKSEDPAAPRRASAASAIPVAGMTPADVAAKAGTEDALDALLSAAAFLTIVRRQPRFTRRELMSVFDEIPGEFPRTLEAQIKGIGKLARNGSLRRIDDEHFGLSRELVEQFEPLLRGES